MATIESLKQEIQVLEIDNEFQKQKNEDMEHRLSELEQDDKSHREYIGGFTKQIEDSIKKIQHYYNSIVLDKDIQLDCAREIIRRLRSGEEEMSDCDLKEFKKASTIKRCYNYYGGNVPEDDILKVIDDNDENILL